MILKPCCSPYCECDVGKCTHPGFYDNRQEAADNYRKKYMIHDIVAIETAVAYRKHLDERPSDYKKPTVFFTGTALFDTEMYPGHEVAHVRTVNHPAWGSDKVRTSSVLKKFNDGSFETRNTLYKPYVEMMGS